MSDERAAAALERELEAIRGNLTGIVRELSRRKDDLIRGRWQLLLPSALPSERTLTTVAFATAGAVVAGSLAVRHHNRQPAVRARRLLDAVQRISDDPRRLAPKRSALGTFVALGLGVLAAYAAVRVAQKVLAAREPTANSTKPRAMKLVTSSSTGTPTDAWQALNPERSRR